MLWLILAQPVHAGTRSMSTSIPADGSDKDFRSCGDFQLLLKRSLCGFIQSSPPPPYQSTNEVSVNWRTIFCTQVIADYFHASEKNIYSVRKWNPVHIAVHFRILLDHSIIFLQYLIAINTFQLPVSWNLFRFIQITSLNDYNIITIFSFSVKWYTSSR